MSRAELLQRARRILGGRGVVGVDVMLQAALDEVEARRDAAITYDWRASCQAHLDGADGRITVDEAAERLGCTPKSVRHQWTRLGIAAPLAPGICEVVARDPGAGDREIAAALQADGYAHATRDLVRSARLSAGLPDAHERRRQAEQVEVASYVVAYPWASPADILDGILADGWPWRLSLYRVAECVGAVHRG